ncbi:hypothetical protein NMY22_g10166 [Coprinellus aureogranulatus]|nr:hypothetical protein NMY22_g10166 [Coprinellus aureogranulatus]
MPVHVHHGTPSVGPDSDVDWKQTPHSSLLEDIPIPFFVHWGRLLVALVQRSYSAEAKNSGGGEAVDEEDLDGSLVESIEKPLRSKGSVMVDVATRLKEGGTLPAQVSCLEVAVRLESNNSHFWYELGWAYYHLVQSTPSTAVYYDQAVKAHRNALEAVGSPGGTDQGELLFSLGTALGNRYGRFGNHQDLSEAITVHRGALALRPPGHPDRAGSLFILGNALSRTGSVSDLQESVILSSEAIKLSQQDPPSNAFANAFADMVYQSDRALRELTSSHCQLPELLHPSRSPEEILDDYANALRIPASTSSLTVSIRVHPQVLAQHQPPGHPDHDQSLGNLTHSLSEETGSSSDLQEVLYLHREAPQGRSPGHADRDRSLNLAPALSEMGSSSDLQISILWQREALELCPPGHPGRSQSLDNLACSLSKTGSPGDLQESISLHREALGCCPPGHPNRINLLINSQSRFRGQGL